MKNEKLNVDRCWNASAPDVDDLGCHRWRALPYIEQTEHGPIAWHVCERCPARALHDPETEDGFEPEPVVVYPSSCFEPVVAAGGDVRDPAGARWAVVSVGTEAPPIPGLSGERVLLRAAYGGGTLNASLATVRALALEAGCGCPMKASGEVVHHDGCAEFQAAVEALLRENDLDVAEEQASHAAEAPGVDNRRLDDGRVSLQRAPEPLPMVHPPTDPAPPSEELRQAMAERDPWLDAPLTGEERKAFEAAEHETGVPWGDDDTQTLKRSTPVRAIA